MRDGFGREIDYLRVSITDRCNLRCQYCMPQELESVPHESILRFEEVLRLCEIAVRLGIRRFRVTGGEPLVRKGAADFLKELRQVPGVEFLAITTNGTLLKAYREQLAQARLDSVNISLDTLSKERYRRLTGFDGLADVLDGMDAALEAGIHVKLNCVLMRGVNQEDILPLAALAEAKPVDVRFIELMPLGAGRGFEGVRGAEALAVLRQKYPDLEPAPSGGGGGPARYFGSKGLLGRIGFISPISDHFCGGCNRVRLSSEGFLKLCLYHGEGTDLRALLRGGAGDGEIRAAMERAILAKPEGHRFGSGGDEQLSGLSRIGG